MSKRQPVIFITILVLISIFSLTYGAQVLADLTTLYKNPGGPLGTELILSSARTAAADEITEPATQQVINQRLENLHLAGAYRVTPQNEQLLVTLPQSENMPYITSVLSHIGEIEFINGGEAPPIGRTIKTAWQTNPGQDIYQTLFTGQEIVSVTLPDSANGQIFYQLNLKPAVVERLNDFLEQSDNGYICTVMDKEVLNCSMMYHWSENTLEILPGLSSGTVISLADLAIFLDSGPLPMPLRVEPR